jgi:hypothetical protein
MSRIAKVRYQRPAVVKTSARADSQKRRSPVPIQKSLAVPVPPLRLWRVGTLALLLPEREHRMGYRVDPDHTHSCAIVREIGERLGALLKPEPEPPEGLKKQIDRLRELEEQSPSQRLSAGTRFAAEPKTARPNMDEQCHR